MKTIIFSGDPFYSLLGCRITIIRIFVADEKALRNCRVADFRPGLKKRKVDADYIR
jgi:hypothetical protein